MATKKPAVVPRTRRGRGTMAGKLQKAQKRENGEIAQKDTKVTKTDF